MQAHNLSIARGPSNASPTSRDHLVSWAGIERKCQPGKLCCHRHVVPSHTLRVSHSIVAHYAPFPAVDKALSSQPELRFPKTPNFPSLHPKKKTYRTDLRSHSAMRSDLLCILLSVSIFSLRCVCAAVCTERAVV